MSQEKTYRYLHFDVFTDKVLSGNQLAVYPDARGLDPAIMQAIALEMAFSETTFVFPPEDPATDFRVRIFTPRAELPMAGHPTIGTTFALAREGRIAGERTSIMLGLGIGPTRVELEWSSDRLHFAWMTQHLPEFGRPLPNLGEMAAALGVQEADIRSTNMPIQMVSCGLPFLYVPLASRSAVDAAELDRQALLRFCKTARIDEPGLFIFSTQPANDGATVYSRMFAPGFGVPEDPATGSASGPLGSYLVRHAAAGPEEAAHMISLQGVKMGRPSHIEISIGTAEGQITSVRVGGQAVFVGEGTLQT